MGSLLHKNRATIVCGVIIALLLGGLAAWAHGLTGAGPNLVALVHDSDGTVHEMALGTDATLEVTTSLGSNTIVVEGGAVRMSAADCPTGACLRQRQLAAPGGQIICLPHKLWIEVVPAGEQGGEMDTALVDDEGSLDVVAR